VRFSTVNAAYKNHSIHKRTDRCHAVKYDDLLYKSTAYNIDSSLQGSLRGARRSGIIVLTGRMRSEQLCTRQHGSFNR